MPSAIKVSELIEFLQQSFDPDHRIYIYLGSVSHVPLIDPRELFIRENNADHKDLGSHVRAKLTYAPVNVLPKDAADVHKAAVEAVAECRQLAKRYMATLETAVSDAETNLLAAITNGPAVRVDKLCTNKHNPNA